MIRFEQLYVEDGVLCGVVYLDDDNIGQFQVTVPQWDELRKLSVDGSDVWVLNQKEADVQRAAEAANA